MSNKESQFYIGIVLLLLLFLNILVFVKGKSSHRPELAEVKKIMPVPTGSTLTLVESAPVQPPPQPIEQFEIPPLPRDIVSGIYRYSDAQGGTHFADQLDKVPADYRASVTFTPAVSGEISAFAVEIEGNHVLVPVTLRNGGKSETALLLLDTGCTITTISEELAARLNIDSSAAQLGTTQVADGRMIDTRFARIDELIVGGRSQAAAEVSIIARTGTPQRHDGLLGMSFLRQNHYQVDYDNGLIRWQ